MIVSSADSWISWNYHGISSSWTNYSMVEKTSWQLVDGNVNHRISCSIYHFQNIIWWWAPQNHWRSHPGLTFPSFHLAKSHWPSHVLRRSLGSPRRSYRFRWKRWRRAAWRYRGNLPVVIRIYNPINITTATPPIQGTQVTPKKWTVPSHNQDFCRVMTDSLPWLPSPFFKTGNHQMISGPRRKRYQTAQRCSLEHWHVPLPDLCFFQEDSCASWSPKHHQPVHVFG